MPENIREILYGSISDVCLDRHLTLDVNKATERLLQSSEFQVLASTWGPNFLEEGTEKYQEAVWACYDFADDLVLDQ